MRQQRSIPLGQKVRLSNEYSLYQKAVHIIVGDSKFLSSCQENFNWLDDQLIGRWIVCSSFVEVDNKALDVFRLETHGVRCLVFFHGLWPTQKAALNLLDSKLHISIGFLWGGDYSNDALSYHLLHDQQTRRLTFSRSRYFKFLPFLIFDALIFCRLWLHQRPRKQSLRGHLEALDFVVCGWEADEARFLPCSGIKTLPNFNPYYQIPPICNTTVDFKSPSKLEKTVIIGNSGTPTNNHLDVIEMIERVNPAITFQFTVIISYGDSSYIEILKAAPEKTSILLKD
jgi:hypothetical protein